MANLNPGNGLHDLLTLKNIPDAFLVNLPFKSQVFFAIFLSEISDSGQITLGFVFSKFPLFSVSNVSLNMEHLCV